jgi:hypothetical protein
MPRGPTEVDFPTGLPTLNCAARNDFRASSRIHCRFVSDTGTLIVVMIGGAPGLFPA